MLLCHPECNEESVYIDKSENIRWTHKNLLHLSTGKKNIMTEISTRHTFSKKEKLCSDKTIGSLFLSGESFVAYPLRVVYLLHDETDAENQYASVLISVSKKRFKRAVKRNRIKRLVREAYRLNKSHYTDLLKIHNKRIDIAFIYLKNELAEYSEIEKSILKTVTQLKDKIEKVK